MSPGTRRLILLLAATVAERASGAEVPGQCPAATPRASSLPVRPRVLWQAEIPSTPLQGSVALAGDRLAVAAGPNLYLFSRAGAPQGRWNNESGAPLSLPVADAEGNFYVAADVAAAVDGRGRPRWTIPLRRDEAREGIRTTPFVLAPGGHLISAQADGRVQALDKETGRGQWSKFLPGFDDGFPFEAVSGRGSIVAVNLSPQRGVRFYEPGSGDLMGTLAGEGQRRVSGAAAGFLASVATPATTALALYDPGLRPTWRLDVPAEEARLPLFVDHRGALVVLEAALPRGNPRARDRVRRHGCDGQAGEATFVRAPSSTYLGAFFTLGADGTSYTLALPHGSARRTVELMAFDPAFHPLWSLSFPGYGLSAEGQSAPALDDDGRLFFVLQKPDGAGTLVAVQSRSPGLAATAWPTTRNDNRRTGWSSR